MNAKQPILNEGGNKAKRFWYLALNRTSAPPHHATSLLNEPPCHPLSRTWRSIGLRLESKIKRSCGAKQEVGGEWKKPKFTKWKPHARASAQCSKNSTAQSSIVAGEGNGQRATESPPFATSPWVTSCSIIFRLIMFLSWWNFAHTISDGIRVLCLPLSISLPLSLSHSP